jgi:UDP-N-acetylglucosamine transferase subunit ALG13
MILVVTGTTGFDALAKEMDLLAPSLGDKVVMQIGTGRYVPQQAEHFGFAPSLVPYYEQASLVVSHGGLATCIEVLEHGKPLIAFSNPDRYDQHQQDILRVLSEQGYLIWCQDLANLPEALEAARSGSFKRYVTPDCAIHKAIKEYLADAFRPRRPR